MNLSDQAPSTNEDRPNRQPLNVDKPRFFNALRKSRKNLFSGLTALLTGSFSLSQEEIEELHEALIVNDVGLETSDRIIESIERSLKHKSTSSQTPIDILREQLVRMLEPAECTIQVGRNNDGPTVILMVGVNGTGKTTTCAKIANLFQQQGHSTMLAACDTFRAAATEQLQIWGQRLAIPVVAQNTGADPAAVAHDALNAAIARKTSVLLIDTAGRQQSRDDLMRQLNKIYRVIQKIEPSAPHETLITIDASTGQNALVQVRQFNQHTPISGICLSKLDGSAKGGIAVAISDQFSIPIAFVGLGETIDDIARFDARDYVSSLLQTNSQDICDD